jgi:maltose alpha-D-glucosyltransferase/alpha-amylase
MRLYGRGIRRRLAPMLRGDERHIELAYALQFSLPGTPALRYGEEIGMGEDLSLDGREAVRTPMHWDGTPNAGFSTATPDALFRPIAMTGRFGAKNVNVRAQQGDTNSLLRWFEHLIHTLRNAPEIGTGTCKVVDAPLPRSVLAHRFESPAGSILLLHNLADTKVTIDIGPLPGMDGTPYDLFVDGPYTAPTNKLKGLELNGWGYRWIRLSRSDQG